MFLILFFCRATTSGYGSFRSSSISVFLVLILFTFQVIICRDFGLLFSISSEILFSTDFVDVLLGGLPGPFGVG